MELPLNAVEVRILGTLMEKKLATPDIYPLSLNALTNGCNQKSNREPVMALDEETVREAVEGLRGKGFVMKSDYGRVRKYSHLFKEKFSFLPRDEAALAVLLLRGPQTLGEIRTRCERLHTFDSAEELERCLEDLMTHSTPWVTRLPVQPGRKEPRFAHLLMGEPDVDALESVPSPAGRSPGLAAEVARLRQELEELREQFLAFKASFE